MKLPSKFIFVTILLLKSLTSFAGMSSIAFWKNHSPRLMFTTAAQSIYLQNCSSALIIQAQDYLGSATTYGSNITVNLSATGGSTTFYSDAACSTSTTTATILAGNSNVTVYFSSTSLGTPILTAAATSQLSATQSQTVTIYPYTWMGGGANPNWSTAANWAGGAVPGSANLAVFNNYCSSNCSPTVNVAANALGIQMTSGYSGTITQNSGSTITLGSSGWNQAGGSFVGSSTANNITTSGSVNITGGSFTSTAGTLSIARNLTVSPSATFNANDGSITLVNYDGVRSVDVGSSVFNNVTLGIGAGWNDVITVTGTWNIGGNLTITGSSYNPSINSGILAVSGNLTLTGNIQNKGTALIKLVGGAASSQTISSTGTRIPNLEIASSGTVTLSGTVPIYNNYTFTSAGTFVTTGSTLLLQGPNSEKTITGGSGHLNHLTLANSAQGYSDAFAVVGTVYVDGNLTMSCSSYGSYVNGGTINLSGNISASGSCFQNGTTNLRMVGDSGSNVNVTTSGGASIPSLEIASAGTVTFTTANPVDIGGNFLYTSGTVVTTGSTVRMVGDKTQTLTPGNIQFTNFVFSKPSVNPVTLTGTLTVLGNLTLTSSNYWPNVNGGTISIAGSVTGSGNWAGGSSSLTFNGTAAQTVTQSSTKLVEGLISISNTSAPVSLGSNVSFNSTGQSLTMVSGSTLNIGSGYTLTIKNNPTLNGGVINKNGGTLVVNGVTVSGTGSLYGGTVNP